MYMYLQANIFVLAWSRDGQMLAVAEKIILPLLTAYMFLLIVLGAVAVGLQSQIVISLASVRVFWLHALAYNNIVIQVYLYYVVLYLDFSIFLCIPHNSRYYYT